MNAAEYNGKNSGIRIRSVETLLLFLHYILQDWAINLWSTICTFVTKFVPNWKLHNSVISSPPHSASLLTIVYLVLSKLPQLLILPEFIIPTHFFHPS